MGLVVFSRVSCGSPLESAKLQKVFIYRWLLNDYFLLVSLQSVQLFTRHFLTVQTSETTLPLVAGDDNKITDKYENRQKKCSLILVKFLLLTVSTRC